MDAYISAPQTTSREQEPAMEIAQWLRVSGDLDDFIYYGEEHHDSER